MSKSQHQNDPHSNAKDTDEMSERPEDMQEAPAEEAKGTEENEVEKLKAELSEMKDRWMRSEADKQNIINRSARELQDAHSFGLQKFATDIVESAENLRRAVAAIPTEVKDTAVISQIREGLESTERGFLSVLERHGIKRHDAEGQPFDSNLHQAMQEVDSKDHKPGDVVNAYSSAWTLNDRLIKPAMVTVASKKSGS